jgi:hypothetical protein
MLLPPKTISFIFRRLIHYEIPRLLTFQKQGLVRYSAQDSCIDAARARGKKSRLSFKAVK